MNPLSAPSSPSAPRRADPTNNFTMGEIREAMADLCDEIQALRRKGDRNRGLDNTDRQRLGDLGTQLQMLCKVTDRHVREALLRAEVVAIMKNVETKRRARGGYPGAR